MLTETGQRDSHPGPNSDSEQLVFIEDSNDWNIVPHARTFYMIKVLVINGEKLVLI